MEYVLNTLEKSISGAVNEINNNTNTEIANRKALIDRTAETNTVTVGDAENTLNLLSNGKLQNNGQEIALMSDVEDILEPYTVNLTNLLSAQDSESISTAIGGIDNLNATVTKNQVIFGTLANGTVAVGIRVLGTQTTLTYFVDSLAGLTVNEVIITNTSGTLSKTVNTHEVLTENMVINSLTSDETTLPLSAAQGKALNEKILNSGKVYVIDGSNLTVDSPSSEQISEAIGGWDNLVNAIQNNYVILIAVHMSTPDTHQVIPVLGVIQDTRAHFFIINASSIESLIIVNNSGELSLQVMLVGIVNTASSYGELQTSDKTFIGSINELNTKVNSKASSQDITDAINALDKAEVSAGTGEVISSVSQEDGVVTVQKKTLVEADIPTLGVAKINGLQSALDAKQDSLTPGTGLEITEGNVINVTLDTTVFFVAEQLPASPTDEQKKKICLIPATSSSVNNEYTEYVWVVDDEHADGYWKEFGTYTSEVDLTPYLKSADAETTYQKINDSSLLTNDKTITGAINENFNSIKTTNKSIGQPTIEEIELTTPDETGYVWFTNHTKTTSAGYSIKHFQLNKGDLLLVNAFGSTSVNIIQLTDNTYNKPANKDLYVGIGSLKTYSYLATEDCFVAVSYAISAPGSYIHLVKSSQNIAIADAASSTAALHKIYESYGAVYNESAGYWELNGLTDLTEEEMYDIYLWTHNIINQPDLTSAFTQAPIRTTFAYSFKKIYRTTIGVSLDQAFLGCNQLEVICLNSIRDSQIQISYTLGTACHNAFNSCSKLREISNVLYISRNSENIFVDAFAKCFQLSKIRIKGLRQDVSFADSPLISYESLNYLVTTAANTSAITVTVHPTTYSYLTGTAQPTAEVGGTTEEWQALVTAAQEKQISFAVPEETQSEVTK